MDKKVILQEKEKRMVELKPIVFKGFKTSEELKLYLKKIKKYCDEYDALFQEIQQLKWELMTPEEREQYLKEEEISKLKREGKL